jgi:hypothetical protein
VAACAWRSGVGARLGLARALLSGLTAAAVLPDLVRPLGGDVTTCVSLGALFALGALASELPSALSSRLPPRTWLMRAGTVQAFGLLGMALSPSLSWLRAATAVVGLGAGMCTGAEARASVALGGDAVAVARAEVWAALGKAAACLVTASFATACGLGARRTLVLTAALALVGAALARTLGGLSQTTTELARGPASRPREGSERRRVLSLGPVALVLGIAAMTLAARGTDQVDAFAVARFGLVASAAMLTGKGLVARMLAPTLTTSSLHGAALAALLAALGLSWAARWPSAFALPCVALACGVVGGAAAASRGVLFARIGVERVAHVAATEATLRRLSVAAAALLLPPALRARGMFGPHLAIAGVALVGAAAVMVPRAVRTVLGRPRFFPS